MKAQRWAKTLGKSLVAAIAFLPALGLRADVAAPPPANDGAPEVLTNGPIHEAYAEPRSQDPDQGIVAPKEPPPAVEEAPPTEKPEGDDVKWIPGYWSWDQGRNDYIWVSGVWRVPPRERSWVPGYWTAVDGGWSYTSGFWMAAADKRVEYLPSPPVSLEVGPPSPEPSPDHLWTPGSWVWIGTRYAWRPGYWVAASPDWVWEPSHYVWSPGGYVFVDGYWDLTIGSRGVLFAPVYFHPRPVIVEPVYAEPVYVEPVVVAPVVYTPFIFTPSIVISTTFITANFFIAPGCHHYYFGDCYDPIYVGFGFRPWFEFDHHHGCYDPIFWHERWHHRRHHDDHDGHHDNDHDGHGDGHGGGHGGGHHDGDHDNNDWEGNLHAQHDERVKNPASRPPKTYKEVAAISTGSSDGEKKRRDIAAPIGEIAAQPTQGGKKFKPVDEGERKKIVEKGKELTDFRDGRAKWEDVGGKMDKGGNGKGKVVSSPEIKEPVIGGSKDPVKVKQPKGTKDVAGGGDTRHNPDTVKDPGSQPKHGNDDRDSGKNPVKHTQQPVDDGRDNGKGKTKDVRHADDGRDNASPGKNPVTRNPEPRDVPDVLPKTGKDTKNGKDSKDGKGRQVDNNSPGKDSRDQPKLDYPKQPVRQAPDWVEVPKSPVSGDPAGNPGKKGNPPSKPEAPRPDPVVNAPKSSDPRSNDSGKSSKSSDSHKSGSSEGKSSGNSSKGKEKNPKN